MTALMPWIKRRWPMVLAIVFCAVIVSQPQFSTAAKVVVVVLAIGALTVWNVARTLRVHATVNRLAALGKPDAVLALVEPELASSRAADVQVPFSIYKATALFLRGAFEESLALLESVEPSMVRGNPGRTWRFLHASQRLSCLAFLGRTDEAREMLEEVERFALTVPTDATRVIVQEARAKIAFFEDRHEESRAIFLALLDDGRMMPVSRALYHYFLGRIALAQNDADDAGTDAGDDDDAHTHLDRARELAPETFIPAAVDELLA